jgi:hypothetical protein
VRRLWLRDWTPHLESNQVLAPAPTARAAAQLRPFVLVAAVVLQERTDRHPAVLFAAVVVAVASVPGVPPVVGSAARALAAPGGVHQDADVIAFCLPARPESRRCYQSPQFIP